QPVEIDATTGQPKPNPPPGLKTTKGHTTAFLDSIYRQLHVGDDVVVLQVPTKADPVPELLASTVGSVDEKTAQTPTKVLLPVSMVTLDSKAIKLTPKPTVTTDPTGISFHFTFVDAGTVTVVAATELTPADFSASNPLSIGGIPDRPPGVDVDTG